MLLITGDEHDGHGMKEIAEAMHDGHMNQVTAPIPMETQTENQLFDISSGTLMFPDDVTPEISLEQASAIEFGSEPTSTSSQAPVLRKRSPKFGIEMLYPRPEAKADKTTVRGYTNDKELLKEIVLCFLNFLIQTNQYTKELFLA